MRVEDLLRPVLEGFAVFAKKVDARFLSYFEKEELYRGIEEAWKGIGERGGERGRRGLVELVRGTIL